MADSENTGSASGENLQRIWRVGGVFLEASSEHFQGLAECFRVLMA